MALIMLMKIIWDCIYHRRVSMLSCMILLKIMIIKQPSLLTVLDSMFISAIRFGIVQTVILPMINWINARIIYLKILCKILLYIWAMKRALMIRDSNLLIILPNLLKKIMLIIEALELIICNLMVTRALLRRIRLLKSLLHHLINRWLLRSRLTIDIADFWTLWEIL